MLFVSLAANLDGICPCLIQPAEYADYTPQQLGCSSNATIDKALSYFVENRTAAAEEGFADDALGRQVAGLSDEDRAQSFGVASTFIVGIISMCILKVHSMCLCFARWESVTGDKELDPDNDSKGRIAFLVFAIFAASAGFLMLQDCGTYGASSDVVVGGYLACLAVNWFLEEPMNILLGYFLRCTALSNIYSLSEFEFDGGVQEMVDLGKASNTVVREGYDHSRSGSGDDRKTNNPISHV